MRNRYRWILLYVPLALVGCGYGKTSPKAYEIAKALVSICDRQAKDRLDKVAQMVEDAHQVGELSARETEWLRDIIADGRAGNWAKGQAAARELMQAQVEGGP